MSGILEKAFFVLFGIIISYILQHIKTKKEEKRKTVKDINNLQAHLIIQYNTLMVLARELEVAKSDSKGLPLWLSLRALIPPIGVIINFDISNLFFLFKSGDEQLIFEINIQIERYNRIILLVNSRFDIHTKQFQPIFEKISDEIDSLEDLEKAIGEKLLYELKQLTQDIDEGLLTEVPRHKKLINKIRTYCLSELGPVRILGVE
jgi:ABC-type cobalt transport system substrate-binding protein